MKTHRLGWLAVRFAAFVLCAGASYSHAQSPKALLLFGGDDHKTFLGCLNCGDSSAVSVCNEYGEFGSEYSSTSIWNDYSHFGNEYSSQSPWNDYASDAPIIVDKDGNSYGYLSTNTYHRDRTRIDWLVTVLEFYEKTKNLDQTRKKMCG